MATPALSAPNVVVALKSCASHYSSFFRAGTFSSCLTGIVGDPLSPCPFALLAKLLLFCILIDSTDFP